MLSILSELVHLGLSSAEELEADQASLIRGCFAAVVWMQQLWPSFVSEFIKFAGHPDSLWRGLVQVRHLARLLPTHDQPPRPLSVPASQRPPRHARRPLPTLRALRCH